MTLLTPTLYHSKSDGGTVKEPGGLLVAFPTYRCKNATRWAVPQSVNLPKMLGTL